MVLTPKVLSLKKIIKMPPKRLKCAYKENIELNSFHDFGLYSSAQMTAGHHSKTTYWTRGPSKLISQHQKCF